MKKKNRLRLILSLLAVIVIAAIIVAVGIYRKSASKGPGEDPSGQQTVQESETEQESTDGKASDTSETEASDSSEPESDDTESVEGSEEAETQRPEAVEDQGDIVITVPDDMSQGGL